jgi:hypothetical protein
MKHLLISVVSLFHHHHHHDQPQLVFKPVVLEVVKPSLDVGLLDRTLKNLPQTDESKVVCVYPVSAPK